MGALVSSSTSTDDPCDTRVLPDKSCCKLQVRDIGQLAHIRPVQALTLKRQHCARSVPDRAAAQENPRSFADKSTSCGAAETPTRIAAPRAF